MTIDPLWRSRFFAFGAAIVAIWMGGLVAQGEYFWPLICSLSLLGLAIARLLPFPLGTILLGALVFGYIVGNRGFAQISLAGRFPLLPAEAVLLVAGPMLLWQSAWRHELPVRRDLLNLSLLVWILGGAARFVFDFRLYGVLAIRDFATVYYAAFFYLAQAAARDPSARRFLSRVVLFSIIILLPIYGLFTLWPQFFVNTLTLRGTPLIFFKDDLASTCLAVGSVLFFLRRESGGGRWNIAVSLALSAATLATTNRASMLGLFVATTWLTLRGRWQYAALQVVSGAIVALLILLAAAVTDTSWRKTPVYGLYERLSSLVDPAGQATYTSSETANKGDNNRFRLVWWHAVIEETRQGNPYLGLGFGHDLADRFVREYYPEDTEEFSVRSPHNILITLFARTGALGLTAFLVVLAAMARETWKALTLGAKSAALWCAAWTLFTSACFGVVLEGPMGAVVFWIIVGVAHATSVAGAEPAHGVAPSAADRETPAPTLPSSAASVSGEHTAS